MILHHHHGNLQTTCRSCSRSFGGQSRHFKAGAAQQSILYVQYAQRRTDKCINRQTCRPLNRQIERKTKQSRRDGLGPLHRPAKIIHSACFFNTAYCTYTVYTGFMISSGCRYTLLDPLVVPLFGFHYASLGSYLYMIPYARFYSTSCYLRLSFIIPSFCTIPSPQLSFVITYARPSYIIPSSRPCYIKPSARPSYFIPSPQLSFIIPSPRLSFFIPSALPSSPTVHPLLGFPSLFPLLFPPIVHPPLGSPSLYPLFYSHSLYPRYTLLSFIIPSTLLFSIIPSLLLFFIIPYTLLCFIIPSTLLSFIILSTLLFFIIHSPLLSFIIPSPLLSFIIPSPLLSFIILSPRLSFIIPSACPYRLQVVCWQVFTPSPYKTKY